MHHGPLAAFLALILLNASAQAQEWKTKFKTRFENSSGNESADYTTGIEFYKRLAEASDAVTITPMGPTDSGRPLHLVVISDRSVAPDEIASDERSVLLINNAIHPGEPDGVDASMAFARDLAFDNDRYGEALKNVIVAIIPFYNIGGALNRNSHSRANQNGPREYGFRGNARNFDLNRDFIKCDTRNARSFAELFHTVDPDLFLDTHVSNGADYQYVMTSAHSQKDKLGYGLGTYLEENVEPTLFGGMLQAGFPTVPYVNSGGRPPDQGGFTQFLETPRYSTGYAALFQTIGFMTETHMLKPYSQRVAATREFMDQSLALLQNEGKALQRIRREDRSNYHQQDEVPISWTVDRENPSRIEFRGYEASFIPSKITPGNRLKYDRDRPFVRNIPFYNDFQPRETVTLPTGYLIPAQWHAVIELMRLNQVEMRVIETETVFDADVYRVDDFTTRSSPYEGHYFHDTVTLSSTFERVTAKAGDIVIPIHQDRARYVVETLEPAAMDSLFRWNYFETILQRKEYFSSYVFEDSAEEMLDGDEALRADFEARRDEDSEFAESRSAQLQFLYERSKHNEQAYRRYPIARLRSLPK
ncbi:MAG: M14 family zinc carboxypeptidase [Planctomycetota bacterium]